MNLTTLELVKPMLDIPAKKTSEDYKLGFWIVWASELIENFLNRDLEYKERTEFYKAKGTKRLRLKERPVFTSPAPRVWVDESGGFGQISGTFGSETELTYGDDFFLDLEGPERQIQAQHSSSGILIRNKDAFQRPYFRQTGLLSPFFGKDLGSVKVTYTAGYTAETLPEPIRMAALMVVAKNPVHEPVVA